MKYHHIRKAEFISRPNRFIARVFLDGAVETVHVKNTGRCREILKEGCTVYLEGSDNPMRKTRYDLVAAEKQRQGAPPLLINMDSQIPNHAAEEWLRRGELFGRQADIHRESVFGDSRFDFRIEDKGVISYLEVKGIRFEYRAPFFRFAHAPRNYQIFAQNESQTAPSRQICALL